MPKPEEGWEFIWMPLRRILASLSLILSLGGCAQEIERAPLETTAGAVPVSDRNYEVGIFQEAYVGATMIRVREYVATKVVQNVARSSHDFRISGGFIEISGRAGDVYQVVGETSYGGRTLNVVNIDNYGVMIDAADKPLPKVINMGAGSVVMVYTFGIDPANLSFMREVSERVDTSRPFVNYEIIYSGRVEDTIRLSYREYSPDDLARPAFFQELTYPADQRTLRFREMRIEVDVADSEKIRFRVLED